MDDKIISQYVFGKISLDFYQRCGNEFMYEGYGVYREILNLINGVDEIFQVQIKIKVYKL